MTIREKLTVIQVKLKAPKNLKNTFGGYMYRNAESICEAVKPLLEETKTSLVLADNIVERGSRVYVEATATLFDNESDNSISVTAFAREAETKKGMDDSQVTGATSSYARKYALNGLFLLDDTKDADSDEYHNQISNAKADATLKKPVDKSNIPTSENASEKCSEKQANFIKKLVDEKNFDKERIFNQYKVSSINDLTKAQAKAMIDYLSKL